MTSSNIEDRFEVFKHFQQAYDQFYIPSIKRLGICYEQGIGV